MEALWPQAIIGDHRHQRRARFLLAGDQRDFSAELSEH